MGWEEVGLPSIRQSDYKALINVISAAPGKKRHYWSFLNQNCRPVQNIVATTLLCLELYHCIHKPASKNCILGTIEKKMRFVFNFRWQNSQILFSRGILGLEYLLVPTRRE